MVLATWYKQALKKSILTQIYANKNKVQGVNLDNPLKAQQEVYRQYLKAYKKGAYNLIREEMDPISQQMIPRKYFSGGFGRSLAMMVGVTHGESLFKNVNEAMASRMLRPILRMLGFVSVAILLAACTQTENLKKVPLISNEKVSSSSQQILTGPITQNEISNASFVDSRTSSAAQVFFAQAEDSIEESEVFRKFLVQRDSEHPRKSPEVFINGKQILPIREGLTSLDLKVVRDGQAYIYDGKLIQVIAIDTGEVLRGVPNPNNWVYRVVVTDVSDNLKGNKPFSNQPKDNGKIMTGEQIRQAVALIKISGVTFESISDGRLTVKVSKVVKGKEMFILIGLTNLTGITNSGTVIYFAQKNNSNDKKSEIDLYDVATGKAKRGIDPKSLSSDILSNLRIFDKATLVQKSKKLTTVVDNLGGINLDSVNLNLKIKRDGKGVPLPLMSQDTAMLSAQGFEPVIVGIHSADGFPVLSELRGMVAHG